MEDRQDRVGYEPALRVIGGHLDAEPVYHVSLLEADDGFTVRAHASAHRLDGKTRYFSWERLRDLVTYQTAGRGVRRRPTRHRGMWENFPNGHDDFFRALGHELDEQHAASLTVDEVADGVAISYLRSGSDPLRVERVHKLLRSEDIEMLLNEAQARRSQRPVS